MIKMIHGNASTDIQNLEGTGLDCMYVFAVFVLLHIPLVRKMHNLTISTIFITICYRIKNLYEQ